MYLGVRTVTERRWREGSVGVFGGWTYREVPYQAQVEKHFYRCEHCSMENVGFNEQAQEPYYCGNCDRLIAVAPQAVIDYCESSSWGDNEWAVLELLGGTVITRAAQSSYDGAKRYLGPGRFLVHVASLGGAVMQ